MKGIIMCAIATLLLSFSGFSQKSQCDKYLTTYIKLNEKQDRVSKKIQNTSRSKKSRLKLVDKLSEINTQQYKTMVAYAGCMYPNQPKISNELLEMNRVTYEEKIKLLYRIKALVNSL